MKQPPSPFEFFRSKCNNRDMEKDKGDFKYLTVMYIILIVITLPIVFFMRPVILENIENSTLLEHYALWKEEKREKSTQYSVTLFLDNRPVKVVREITSSSDTLHGAVEALLEPLSDEEKESGYTSFIPEGTTLVGISEESGFFYVEFSSSLLSSSNIAKATEQIKKTLGEYYTLESLTILCGQTVLRT